MKAQSQIQACCLQFAVFAKLGHVSCWFSIHACHHRCIMPLQALKQEAKGQQMDLQTQRDKLRALEAEKARLDSAR